MALGVFDSGVGGLTVVAEIKKRFPTKKIIYFGDTARVPYGPRGKDVVTQFAIEDTKFLLSKGVSEIVVACNTVSALALAEVRAVARVPVWGMIEPATEAAKKVTKNGRIGVIGTRGTIASHAYKKFIPDIVEQACPLFVPFVEEGECEGELIERLVKRYLAFVNEQGIDTLILGCTHYPVLEPIIKKFVEAELIHCGREVANKLSLNDEGEDEYYFSDTNNRDIDIAERILGRRVTIQKAWQ